MPSVTILTISPISKALLAELDVSLVSSLKRIELKGNTLTKEDVLSLVDKHPKQDNILWVGKGPQMPTES